jgi:hypothetical protein
MNQSLWIYQVQSRIRSFSTQTGTAITTARWLLREHIAWASFMCGVASASEPSPSIASLLFSSRFVVVGDNGQWNTHKPLVLVFIIA